MFNTLTINTHFEMLGINPLTFMDEEVESLNQAVISQGRCKSPAGVEIADNAALKKLYFYLDDVAGIANKLADQFAPPLFDLTRYGIIPRNFAELCIHLVSQKLNEGSHVLVKYQEYTVQVQEVLVTYSPAEVSIDQMDLIGFDETVDLIEEG